MHMLDHFHQLFRYDDWANREVLVSLQAASNPPERSLKLLGHILGAEYVWYSRLKSEQSPLAVWPLLNLDECEQQIRALPQMWSQYLNGIEADGLNRNLMYRNSKGEPWTNSVGDILMHVIMHSAYHRGQIASDIRAAGGTPAYTDFIHAVRQSLVE
jgi:uncharacterized damage-inducible protein DinB